MSKNEHCGERSQVRSCPPVLVKYQSAFPDVSMQATSRLWASAFERQEYEHFFALIINPMQCCYVFQSYPCVTHILNSPFVDFDTFFTTALRDTGPVIDRLTRMLNFALCMLSSCLMLKCRQKSPSILPRISISFECVKSCFTILDRILFETHCSSAKLRK